jgi:hypothetical protein
MGSIKAVLGFVAIIGVIYSAFQIVPPELNNFSFTDDIRDVSLVGSSNFHISDQDLVQQVIRKAQDRGITLTPDQVTIQRITTPGLLAVYVAADYTVPVSLPGYSFTLHFTPSSGNNR